MRPTATKKPTFKRNRLSLAVQACCYTVLGALPLANAAPTGGEVVGGSGAISQSGTTTTINQATQNLAINWQSFNVAVDERVQFIQPSASAIALNTILSNDGTTIAGRIDSNGQVILVNANGIFFTSTSVLNVGSIIASGLSINPAAFMNGNYVFNEIPGTSGVVINSGTINASLGGNVALIGKRVENNGLIVANLGTVTLAAGKQAVLTFDSGGLLGVRVSQEILQSELGVDPAVLNSGEIQAQGGRVLLTASQSQDVFSRAVNNAGMEPATSVVVNDDGTFTLGGADVLNSGSINTSATAAGQSGGRIVLIGENVTSSGTLRADAASGNGGEIELHANNMTLLTGSSITSARSESNGNGGIVKVLGDKVGLFDQSTVDVSGANGGGQALIGGDFQGKNTAIRNASETIVNRDTSIFADALQNGNGGKVILWADGDTYFGGNIFVRGGAFSGDGGFVETSGKENLFFRGAVDRTAVNGKNGLLLLDPENITIDTAGPNDGEVSVSDRQVNFGDGGTANFTISAGILQTLLTTGDVTLEANGDININAAITAIASAATAPNNFSLSANDDININAPVNLTGINFSATAGVGCATAALCSAAEVKVDATGNTGSVTVTGANINFTASGDINLEGNVTINNSGKFTAVATTGNFTQSADQSIVTGSGDVDITAGVSASLAKITTGTGSLFVTTSNGDITQETTSTRNLAIGGAATFAAGTNAIVLVNDFNAIAGTITLGSALGTPGAVTLHNSGATTLGAVRATSLTVNASGNLTLSGNVTTTGTTDLNFGLGGGSTFTVTSGLTLSTGALTIDGGSGADTFNIGSSIPGAVRGNSGNDNFNITASGVIISSILGGTGTDTLTGNNQINNWELTAENGGSLNGTNIAFSEIENLVGGTGVDTFVIQDGGFVNGYINGGGAPALSLDTVNLSFLTTGDSSVQLLASAPTAAFSNTANSFTLYQVNSVIANDAVNNANTLTLVGATSTNQWNISGLNSGTVNGTTFAGFNDLVGSNGVVDNFVFGTNGSLSFLVSFPASAGRIDGGTGGGNTLAVNSNSGVAMSLGAGNFSVGASTTGYSNISSVTANSGGTTDLAGVNVNTLVVTSAGNISDSAASPVANLTLSTPGTITLDNQASITGGNFTANTVTLNTASGITGLNTTTANLNVTNTAGNVQITNNGSVNASVLTQTGNIDLENNNGNVTVLRLSTVGASTSFATASGQITLNVNNGAVFGNPNTNYLVTPDVVTGTFISTVLGGDIGTDPRLTGGRPLSLAVRDLVRLTVPGRRAFIYNFGTPTVTIIGTLVDFSDSRGLNQQLLEVDSLDEFDPAIFTEIRNYYYEDIAIMMPADQRLDGTDEEEKDKEKAGTL